MSDFTQTTIQAPLRPKAVAITDANGVVQADVTDCGNNVAALDVILFGATGPISQANPLPVSATFSGTISGGNPAAGPVGSPVPSDADYVGYEDNSGNLIGVSTTNPLPTADTGISVSPLTWTPSTPIGTSITVTNTNLQYATVAFNVNIGSVNAGIANVQYSSDGILWQGYLPGTAGAGTFVQTIDFSAAPNTVYIFSFNIVGYAYVRMTLLSALVGDNVSIGYTLSQEECIPPLIGQADFSTGELFPTYVGGYFENGDLLSSNDFGTLPVLIGGHDYDYSGATGPTVYTAKVDDEGNLYTVESNTSLNPASPNAAVVGITSNQIVPSNTSRTGLVLINTSQNVMSFGLGTAAIYGEGITLLPYGSVWEMDSVTFTTDAIYAIASANNSNVAIQEFS